MTRVILALALLLMPTAALANGGREWVDFDAEAISEACWARSREAPSGYGVAVARLAVQQALDCLEQAIVHHTSELLKPADAAEVREQLAGIQRAINGLYWAIYNDNEVCAPDCGLMPQIYPGLKTGWIFEGILDDVIKERNEYQR